MTFIGVNLWQRWCIKM